MANTEGIINQINPTRLAENLWGLLNIASPTGSEKKAALHFAKMLAEAGAKVKIDNTIINSPNIIGHLKGNRPGKTIQLAGHIDHIDITHSAPSRTDKVISGRGAADMKNGLAGIIEIITTLNDLGCDFPGQILVTVYGLHEAPVGDSSGLLNLIKQNIKGDAAIVFEGPDDKAAIMANGMSIWNIAIKNKNAACHELSACHDHKVLLKTTMDVVNTLHKEDCTLGQQPNAYPLLPKESLFVGQLHYGDFYNRVPDIGSIQGTRRWNPDKTFKKIQFEFTGLIRSVSTPKDISIENDWIFVGDSYEISPEEPIVQSLCRSYQNVFQKQLPVEGHSSVTDASRLVNDGKIPTVLWGFGTETGHSNNEYIEISRLESSCKVALLTVLDYLDNNCHQT